MFGKVLLLCQANEGCVRPTKGHAMNNAKLNADSRRRHSQARRREREWASAEGIIAGKLDRLEWKKAELRRWPKRDAAKMALAARLCRETTMTIGDIVQRLHMGSRRSLGSKPHQSRRANEKHT